MSRSSRSLTSFSSLIRSLFSAKGTYPFAFTGLGFNGEDLGSETRPPLTSQWSQIVNSKEEGEALVLFTVSWEVVAFPVSSSAGGLWM